MQPQQRHARRGSSASPARQQLYRHARARSQVAAPRRSLVASSSSLLQQQQQQQQRPRHSSLADDFLTSAESRAHSCDTSDRSHQHNKMNDNDNNSTGGHTATAPSRRSSDGGGVNEDVVVHDVYPRYRIAAGIRAAAVVRRRCKHNNNNNNDDDDDDDDSVVWTAESDGALCIRALPRGAVRRRLPGREGTYATCLLYVPDKSSNNNSNNNNDNDTSSSSRLDSDASSAAWQQQQQSPVSTAAAAGDDGVSSARHHNSDGGRVWVGMCDGYMRIYDANTAQLVCEHVHHCGAVYSMLELEGAVYTAAQDWKVHQWRARDGAYVRLFAGHRGSVRCLAAYTGPTGAVLFSGSDDGAVRAWNPYTPLLAATTSPASAAALRQAACLHVFAAPASSSCDGDTTTPSPRGGGSGVRALLVVPHASQLWAGHEGGVVRVWDLATLRCVRECAAHRATLTSLCVVATRVWSADAHGRVLLWDMHTLTPIQDITTTATATAAAATSPSQHAIWSLTAVQSCTVWRVWATTASGVVQCYHAETRPFVTRAQQPQQQQRRERQQQQEREVNFCHDANDDTSSSSPAVHVALDDGATRVSLLPSSSQPVSAAAQTPSTTTTTTTHAALTAMIDTLPTSVRAYVAALRGERDAAQHTCAQLRARARDAATQQTATLHVMQTELEMLRAQLQRSQAQSQRPQPSTARASVSPSSSVVVPSALLLPAESAASSSSNNNDSNNDNNNTNAVAAAAKHADVVTQLRAQADDDDALLHDGGVRAHVILQNAQTELARVQHDMEQANDDDNNDNEDNCAAVQVRRTRDDDDERKHSSSRARTSGLLADDVRAAEDAAAQMRTRHHELEQYMRTQLQPQLASLQRSCASAQLQLRQSERRYAALQAKYDALLQQQQQRQPRDSGGSNNKVATTSATARA